MKTQQTQQHINAGPTTPAQAPQLSDCHNAPLIERTSGAGNHWLQCQSCNKPTQPRDATSHSPLPWTTEATSNMNGAKTHSVYADGRWIIEAIDVANAAFIVRACNEYEKLKADAIEDVTALADLHKANKDLQAHAQRLADALKKVIKSTGVNGQRFSIMPSCGAWADCDEALAQDNESPADADALEALDQLEQLEGGE